jgi:hypothetical protein
MELYLLMMMNKKDHDAETKRDSGQLVYQNVHLNFYFLSILFNNGHIINVRGRYHCMSIGTY